MSVVFFGDLFQFPEGSAATNRLFTYAHGLMEQGVKVNVVCYASYYLPQPNGIADGVTYYTPFNQVERSNSFLVRRLQNVNKLIRTVRILNRIHKEDKINAINLWTNLKLTLIIGWILARLYGAKLILECSEHPIDYYEGAIAKKRKSRLWFRIESFLCDGILCISRFLVEFYENEGINPSKLILIPSTVEPGRFSIESGRPVTFPYVGYFGSLTLTRDNVDLLIRSFAGIHSKFPELRLVLGGPGSDEDRKIVLNMAASLGIEDKTIVLDFMPRNEVVHYISNAEVLVMVRNVDLQSKASFPSKLTEFLSTAKPVITVKVGDISDYLTDGKNAYLIEPGDQKALEEKLNYVLTHYEEAKAVGEKGKELTANVFNYKFQAGRLISFIETLKK